MLAKERQWVMEAEEKKKREKWMMRLIGRVKKERESRKDLNSGDARQQIRVSVVERE